MSHRGVARAHHRRNVLEMNLVLVGETVDQLVDVVGQELLKPLHSLPLCGHHACGDLATVRPLRVETGLCIDRLRRIDIHEVSDNRRRSHIDDHHVVLVLGVPAFHVHDLRDITPQADRRGHTIAALAQDTGKIPYDLQTHLHAAHLQSSLQSLAEPLVIGCICRQGWRIKLQIDFHDQRRGRLSCSVLSKLTEISETLGILVSDSLFLSPGLPGYFHNQIGLDRRHAGKNVTGLNFLSAEF